MDSNSATRKDHLKLAKRGLRKGLNIFSPGTHINAKGYTESIADNLVSSVMPADCYPGRKLTLLYLYWEPLHFEKKCASVDRLTDRAYCCNRI